MSKLVLVKPVVTEKSLASGSANRYTFEVESGATKNQIREAVKSVFKVDPIRVNTLTKTKKPKRTGKRRLFAKEKIVKKAIVTLKKGQIIELFETTGK